MAHTLFNTDPYASCSVPVAPLRREPSHRAEQTSQLLFGERVAVLSQNDATAWAHIRCEWDGYEGWCKPGQLQPISAKAYGATRRIVTTSHKAALHLPDGVMYLPPGSELTGKALGMVPVCGEAGRFKGKRENLRTAIFTPEKLLAVCQSFMHTPYIWGGRSLSGIDCSGLVQVAFKLCGVRVPRDASQQALAGEEVHFLAEALPGDVAFFDNADGRIVHVGILADQTTIFHATDVAGRVVSDKIDNAGIISRMWRKRTHNLRTIRRIGGAARSLTDD